MPVTALSTYSAGIAILGSTASATLAATGGNNPVITASSAIDSYYNSYAHSDEAFHYRYSLAIVGPADITVAVRVIASAWLSITGESLFGQAFVTATDNYALHGNFINEQICADASGLDQCRVWPQSSFAYDSILDLLTNTEIYIDLTLNTRSYSTAIVTNVSGQISGQLNGPSFTIVSPDAIAAGYSVVTNGLVSDVPEPGALLLALSWGGALVAVVGGQRSRLRRGRGWRLWGPGGRVDGPSNTRSPFRSA